MLTEVKKALLNNPSLIVDMLDRFGFASVSMHHNEIRCARRDGSNPSAIRLRLTNNEHLFIRDFVSDVSCDLFAYIIKEKGNDFKEVISFARQLTGLTTYRYQKSLEVFGGLFSKVGRRNANAIEHGKIAKHMMHFVRLYLMCFDILEKEEIITYRFEDHDFLMSIRNGKYLDDNDQPTEEFYQIVSDFEKRLEYDKEHTNLPDKPDFHKIKEILINVEYSLFKPQVLRMLEVYSSKDMLIIQ